MDPVKQRLVDGTLVNDDQEAVQQTQGNLERQIALPFGWISTIESVVSTQVAASFTILL